MGMRGNGKERGRRLVKGMGMNVGKEETEEGERRQVEG